MPQSVLFWRRLDVPGLERLELQVSPDGIDASSTVIGLEDGGHRLDHHWQLGPDWRARAVTVERWGPNGHGALRLERSASGWRVDGAPRPDLDGAEEPDLSVTPFCNTLPIRRVAAQPGAHLALDVALIDGPALTVVRSGQAYLRQGPGRLRFLALSGASQGFEADLTVDEAGFVLSYEHLFERVAPT
jgi:hypothetical protein